MFYVYKKHWAATFTLTRSDVHRTGKIKTGSNDPQTDTQVAYNNSFLLVDIKCTCSTTLKERFYIKL